MGVTVGRCQTPSTASYDNRAARVALGWRPRTDFAAALTRLDITGDLRSPPAMVIGCKGYQRDR